jgi:hypothetical protein
MQESPAEYTRRILSYAKDQDGLEVQRETPKKLKKLVKGLKNKEIMKRPASGKWSIGEILAHLADAEMVVGYRMRLILGVNGTSIVAFDQDVWAKNADYAHQDPDLSLAAFRALRQLNVAMLKSLPAEKWNQYGIHEERGKETIRHIVNMMAGHDLNHLRQVEAIAKGKR